MAAAARRSSRPLPMRRLLLLLVLAAAGPLLARGQGIGTADNHRPDYAGLGMRPPAADRSIEQPSTNGLYEREIALPDAGSLKCKNSQKQRDP
jgi:hypothetical protein